MKKIFIFLIFCIPLPVYAESVVINEFVIEPQQQIEIFNTSPNTVDISGWYIDDNGGATFFIIPPETQLLPNHCVVFTDNFNLNKTSADTLRLFDTTGPPTAQTHNLIDSYTYEKSAGSAISFLRQPDGFGSFTTASSNIGFYNGTTQSCIVVPSPTLTIKPSSTPILTPTLIATPVLPSVTPFPPLQNIYITEVMPHPQQGESEWVELYNNNSNTVTLKDWFIDDGDNTGSAPKSFVVSINPYSYTVVELTTSLFNNDKDYVRLLNEKKEEVFKISYDGTRAAYSLGSSRIGEASFCVQYPSKNNMNNSCLTVDSSPTPTIEGTPTPLSLHKEIIISPTYSPSLVIPTQTPNFIQPTTPQQISKDQKTEDKEMPTETFYDNTPPPTPQLIQSLSTISFGFSALSIISLFFRLKNMA